MNNMTEQQALNELERRYGKARQILKDKDNFDLFMDRLESKLRTIPMVGEILGDVSVLVQLVKSYVSKEYTLIPIGSIIAAMSALIYFLSPVDLIPDVIPGVGHLDDAAVVTACLLLIRSDVDEFLQWRDRQGRIVES